MQITPEQATKIEEHFAIINKLFSEKRTPSTEERNKLKTLFADLPPIPDFKLRLDTPEGVNAAANKLVTMLNEYYIAQIQSQNTTADVNAIANKIFFRAQKIGMLTGELAKNILGGLSKATEDHMAIIESKAKTSETLGLDEILRTKIYSAKSEKELGKILDEIRQYNGNYQKITEEEYEKLMEDVDIKGEQLVKQADESSRKTSAAAAAAVTTATAKSKNPFQGMSEQELEEKSVQVITNLFKSLEQNDELLSATNLGLFINFTTEQTRRAIEKPIEPSTSKGEIDRNNLLIKRCDFFASEIEKKFPGKYSSETKKVTALSERLWGKFISTYEALLDKQDEIADIIRNKANNGSVVTPELITNYLECARKSLNFIDEAMPDYFILNLDHLLEHVENIENIVLSQQSPTNKKIFDREFSKIYFIIEKHYDKIHDQAKKPSTNHATVIRKLILDIAGFTVKNKDGYSIKDSCRIKTYQKLLTHLEKDYMVTPEDVRPVADTSRGVAFELKKPRNQNVDPLAILKEKREKIIAELYEELNKLKITNPKAVESGEHPFKPWSIIDPQAQAQQQEAKPMTTLRQNSMRKTKSAPSKQTEAGKTDSGLPPRAPTRKKTI